MGAVVVLIELFRKYFHGLLLTLSAGVGAAEEKINKLNLAPFCPPFPPPFLPIRM
jgi:hypothetical protein